MHLISKATNQIRITGQLRERTTHLQYRKRE